MLSWKDKVAEKLSSLLGDSPSSPSHPDDADYPVLHNQSMPQLVKQSCSPKKSAFTSILSYLPTRRSTDNEQETKSPTYLNGIRTLRVRSLPRRWKANGLKWKDKPLDKNAGSETGSESDETVEISRGDNDKASKRPIDAHNSSGMDKVSIKHVSEEYLPYVTEKSSFITMNLYEFLQSSLPNIVKGCRWVLLYSTLKHGISLRTLLRRSVSLPGPCLLIAGDMQGAVFGGLMDTLTPTAKRKYQGTNHTFVFTTIYGEPRLFRATGANRYYYLCLNDSLAFGGGGNFALCLDEDLLRGTSGSCETFGNECLAHSPEFELKNVELWGFSHSIRDPT